MLKFISINKTFGDIPALSDVNLDVAPGEFVFITGPSGAGKSTLLNLILRKYLPDNGEIFYEDKDITKLRGRDVSKLRQNIGIVFQDFKVLPDRTVRENIEVVLAVKNVPQKEWKERVGQILERVGIAERARLFPAQLSGGEVQRVSLARALVSNPGLILADEPTGNLDWETADAIMDLFEGINKEGKTVIVATHHKAITDRLKKRIVNMRGGKIDSDTGGSKQAPKKERKMEEKTETDNTEKSEEKQVKVKVEEKN